MGIPPLTFLRDRTDHTSETMRMSANEFAVPIDQRYFEDYVPGSSYEYGPISVSEAEIIDFAKKFDTQYIHTDPQKAAQGPFGGLIASGWHTASLMMRLYSDNYISSVAAIASPGVDELRWIKPVRPGDSLSIRVTALEAQRSQSKPQMGMVRVFVEVFNQQKEIVMTLKPMNLLRCRTSPK
jgi:acyl dehydratase